MSRGCATDGTSIFAFATSLICLIILLITFIASIKQLKARKIKNSIKTIYFIATICSIVSVSIYVVFSIICTDSDKIPHKTVFEGFYSILCLCVVIILLLRLHFGFKDSILDLTSYQRWIFIISPILMITLAIIAVVAYFFNIYLRVITFGIVSMLYLGISIYAIILFVHRMHALIALRSPTSSTSIERRRLLHTTIKYVTLLSFALISTWITFILSAVDIVWNGNNFLDLANGIFACLDCVVNILCLYLQYPFAERYYHRFCGCFRNCCILLVGGERSNIESVRSNSQETVTKTQEECKDDHKDQTVNDNHDGNHDPTCNV